MAICKHATFRKYGEQLPIGRKERKELEKRQAAERGGVYLMPHESIGIKIEQLRIVCVEKLKRNLVVILMVISILF